MRIIEFINFSLHWLSIIATNRQNWTILLILAGSKALKMKMVMRITSILSVFLKMLEKLDRDSSKKIKVLVQVEIKIRFRSFLFINLFLKKKKKNRWNRNSIWQSLKTLIILMKNSQGCFFVSIRDESPGRNKIKENMRWYTTMNVLACWCQQRGSLNKNNIHVIWVRNLKMAA